MRRLTVSALIVTLCTAAVPVQAGHKDHDHSPNVRQIAETPLQWPVDSYLTKLAFQDDLVIGAVQGGHPGGVWFQGNVPEGGIGIFRRRSDKAPVQLGRLRCHSTGELSVWRDLVLQGSVRSIEAGSTDTPTDPCDRNGLRITDISDPSRPRQAAFIRIPCGMGGHALVPDGRRLYLYAPSSCQDETETPVSFGPTNEMAVIRILPDRPKASRFATIANIEPMIGCEWIAAVPRRDLAACAADNRFVLLDISDRALPVPIVDSLRTLEHAVASVAFSWDGSYLAFGAKWRLNEAAGKSVSIYNVEDRTNPVPAGSWTVPPGPGWDQQVLSVNFVPLRDGRPVLVAANGTRGVWLLDLSDPARPAEVGHFIGMDTSQSYLPNQEPSMTRSAYWYNGAFFISDEDRIRVLKVNGFDRSTVHFFGKRYNAQTTIGPLR